MHVAYRVYHVHCAGSDLIGRSNHGTRLGPSTGKPHIHGVDIVASPECRHSTSVVIIRGAPKLTGPYDQRVVKQPTRLKVANQRGNWLIYAANT